MEMTTKEIADELGVDKQKVYRFIKKNHIIEAHQKNGVKYFNEAVQTQIKQAFSKSEALHEAHQNHFNEAVNEAVIEVLKSQLEAKDRQIAEMQKLLDQEQQLRMAEHQKILLLEQQEQEKQPKGFWQKIFGKGEEKE